MKKMLLFVTGALLLMIGAGVAVLYRWMQTPNGRLHPVMAVIHQLMKLTGGDFTADLPAARQNMNRVRVLIPLPQVEDCAIEGPHGPIPLRIYTPSGAGPFPVVVFFHGGGFVLGSIQSHENVARQIAQDTGALVISVEYRLAPEHPFPGGHDDCYAATQWAAANSARYNGDPARLFVVGDSAGGNMAATVALHARDAGEPAISGQVLIYPATSIVDETLETHPSVGYVLRRNDLLAFRDWYLPDETQRRHPYASPLLADDLRGLPPAFIVTAALDPLREQGKAYADRLAAAGTPVVYRDFPGMMHGFLSFVDVLAMVPGGTRLLSAPQVFYAEMRAFMNG
jgi:acetyl esterase